MKWLIEFICNVKGVLQVFFLNESSIIRLLFLEDEKTRYNELMN